MEDLLYLEPREDFDKMILGVSERPFAITYDLDAIIEHWTGKFTDDNTSRDEARVMAVEWVDFNVIGAYVGAHTPIYVSKVRHEMLKELSD